jgi:hypothetical protein
MKWYEMNEAASMRAARQQDEMLHARSEVKPPQPDGLELMTKQDRLKFLNDFMHSHSIEALRDMQRRRGPADLQSLIAGAIVLVIENREGELGQLIQNHLKAAARSGKTATPTPDEHLD